MTRVLSGKVHARIKIEKEKNKKILALVLDNPTITLYPKRWSKIEVKPSPRRDELPAWTEQAD